VSNSVSALSVKSKVATLKPERFNAPRKLTREAVGALAPRPDPYEVRDTELKGFLVRVQPSGVMAYYLEIARGKRIKLGRTTALKTGQARDIAERMAGNVANNRDPWDGIRAPSDTTAPTLGEFVAGSNPDEKDVRKWDGDYATWYAANRKQGRAYTENMQRLRTVFALWWKLPITEITAGALETFKTERKRKDKNSNATIRRDLSRLRGVFRLARKRGHANDAFEEVELPDVDTKGKVRFLTDAERKRLEQALGIKETPDYLRVMVRVSLNTGLRRGELFGLTWENVDLKQATLTVEGATSKRQTTRHVALNATAKAALKDWKPKDATGLVFPGRAGKFWTVKKSWAALLRRAEITGFRWHDMRHDFASRLVMGGIDLYTVGELLGHDRVETTKRYAHLAPSHKAAAVGVLDK
jgi:integrase